MFECSDINRGADCNGDVWRKHRGQLRGGRLEEGGVARSGETVCVCLASAKATHGARGQLAACLRYFPIFLSTPEKTKRPSSLKPS